MVVLLIVNDRMNGFVWLSVDLCTHVYSICLYMNDSLIRYHRKGIMVYDKKNTRKIPIKYFNFQNEKKKKKKKKPQNWL